MHTLRNANGLEATVLAFGGILQSLRVPDREGRSADVVLGHDRPEQYRENPAYLGALVGRYANRIGGARYTLDGREYRLTANDGPNHLHGGAHGFHDAEWNVRPLRTGAGDALELTHAFAPGIDGHPGWLDVSATYVLTDANELVVDWRATTDSPTHVNFTQHSYFNLAGHDAGDVLGHELEIDADAFLPVDALSVPTGELRPVDGSPFDFRSATPIGARIDADDEQLRIGNGYDHCFVLRGDDYARAARLFEPRSGRTLTVFTTESGMQLYTGNGLDVGDGKGDVRYGPRAGVALETQHFPDSPNRPDFPSTVLRPGVEYRSRTVYAFGIA